MVACCADVAPIHILLTRRAVSTRATVLSGENTMEVGAEKTPDKAKLMSLDQIDGRTMAAKNARALIESLESDLGGSDRLTAAEREIVRRAALTAAMAEHMEAGWLTGRGVDVAAYCALVNVQRRLLMTVGLQRRSRDVTPDLARYIAAHAVPPERDGAGS